MTRFDLFTEMDLLRREIENSFNNFGRSDLATSSFLNLNVSADYPRLNLSGDDNNLYLEAVVPGINPDELELNVMHDTLTLSGERKEDNGEKRSWYRRERGNGRFLRTIELPVSIDTDRVTADYKHGILSVTLPKAEEMKPKKISVQAA